MAKISARGCVKLAAASLTRTDEDGYVHKTRITLRSDGKVLRAHDLLPPSMAQYGSRGWNRGGYTIIGSLTEKNGRSPIERFHSYATSRGFTPDAVR